MLPRARVVYCSATGVSDVKNLVRLSLVNTSNTCFLSSCNPPVTLLSTIQAYMERLGLWGEGMAYKSFDNFLESITQRGLGAAEMLAMEMKSAGLYVSRGLSFKQAEVDMTILSSHKSHDHPTCIT